MTWQGWLVAMVLVLVAAATTVVRWQLRDLRRQKAEQAKLRQAARPRITGRLHRPSSNATDGPT